MSTIKHNPATSKVIVEIEEGGLDSSKPAKERLLPPPLPLGMLPAYNPPSLRRLRRKKKKAKTGIRFFDAGVIDGSSVYTSWSPTVPLSPSFGFILPNINNTEFFRMMGEIYTAIFNIPQDDFTVKLELITKTSYFSNAVNLEYTSTTGLVEENLKDSAKFEDTVLTLTQAEVDTLRISGDHLLFYSQMVSLKTPPATIKITKIRDVNAPGVTFTPSLKFDVFLVPQIIQHLGRADYYNGIHSYKPPVGATVSDVVFYTEMLNYIYSTLPREFYEPLKIIDFSDFYLWLYQTWQVLKQLPGARLHRGIRDFYETPPYSYYNTYSLLSPAEFPNSRIYTSTGLNSVFPYEAQTRGIGIGNVEWNTKLIFFIIQDGEIYYFWRKF